MAEIIPPPTITKEEVLVAYNAEHGSNVTFVELGRQLALKELQRHRKKMKMDAVVEEVII
jgi:hypothetical protein